MRHYSGELQPAQAVVQRMQSLQLELQQAKQHLRRERRSQAPGARWSLDREAPQQHDEEWLITYLDMVTLLMVAMIMMLALAGPLRKTAAPTLPSVSTDASAYKEVSEAIPPMIAIPFPEEPLPSPVTPPEPPSAAEPASPTLAPLAGTFPEPVVPEQGVHPIKEQLATDPAAAESGNTEESAPMTAMLPNDAQSAAADKVRVAWQHGLPRPSPEIAPPAPPVQPSDTRSEGETVAASLALKDLGKDVKVIINKRSVSFRVNSEILFGTGQTDLSAEGLEVLKRMARVLVKAGYDITVEGYTDSVPLRSGAAYPSNWELSSARASRVVRYLQANGIPKSRLTAVGFADSRPIGDNKTPEGRAQNRRVELVVAKHRSSGD